jgi:hypothetical protein
VPFFFKQAGAKRVSSSNGGTAIVSPELSKIKSRKGDSMPEWAEDLRIREYPRAYRAGAL